VRRALPWLLAGCALARPAFAQDAIGLDAAGLDRAALERDDRDTRLWFWGWMGFYTGGAALEGTLAGLADDRGDRRQALVSAAGCTLGIGGLLIGSVWPGVDLPPPDAPPLEIRRALEAQADREAAAFGWFGHTANALVGIGGSLYLWLGMHRPGMALINLPVSIGVGELQIFTTPTHSRDRVSELAGARRPAP
jgi:hypothetical protein